MKRSALDDTRGTEGPGGESRGVVQKARQKARQAVRTRHRGMKGVSGRFIGYVATSEWTACHHQRETPGRFGRERSWRLDWDPLGKTPPHTPTGKSRRTSTRRLVMVPCTPRICPSHRTPWVTCPEKRENRGTSLRRRVTRRSNSSYWWVPRNRTVRNTAESARPRRGSKKTMPASDTSVSTTYSTYLSPARKHLPM